MDILVETFLKSHPERAAKVLEGLDLNTLKQFSLEADASINDVLARVSPSVMAKIIAMCQAKEAASLLHRFPNLQAAMLLKQLSHEKRRAVLQDMEDNKRTIIERYLQYDHAQIGFYAVMPKLVLTLKCTVEDALSASKLINSKDLPIWVVDAKYKLVGSVDLIKLIEAREEPHTNLEKVVTKDAKWVSGLTNIDTVSELIIREGNKSIAVVGQDNVMLGVVSRQTLKNKVSIQSTQKSSSVEEYIYFSEMLWTGLNKFWSSLK